MYLRLDDYLKIKKRVDVVWCVFVMLFIIVLWTKRNRRRRDVTQHQISINQDDDAPMRDSSPLKIQLQNLDSLRKKKKTKGSKLE